MNAPALSLPALPGRWRTVAVRSYGTRVYRVEGKHTHYVKTTPPRREQDRRFHPAGEAQRLEWLRGKGFPVPEVVEVGGHDSLSWLVTLAVPGVPASTVDKGLVLGPVAELARELHAVEDCPFDLSLPAARAWAATATERGLVDLDDLDPAHAGWSAADLLAELDATPAPEEDLVTCHGDLGADNVLVDPGTGRVTGLIDVGRLGRADRWRDLSLLVRDLGPGVLTEYGTAEDAQRLHFYLLLDEFF
ncbi:aminoglycoside 3'-phosphotransferase [Actinokineospora pegani]|uniref:aminoglycoside 3'-phosphotransferase n=1 Tax=Actinokineospora pegani TaxID=2654637 RepID=UPI0012EAC540|nr:aminoglycoside 3'-phosphotransferase [Actinokineospora pegani]